MLVKAMELNHYDTRPDPKARGRDMGFSAASSLVPEVVHGSRPDLFSQ